MYTNTGKLYRIDQVPNIFKNVCIVHGYRSPTSSSWQCLRSLFVLTNETLNIWTHLLPAVYFFLRFANILYLYGVWNDVYWPLYAYVFSCIMYPLTSAIAHLFNSMSSKAHHICFFFDYGACSLYTLGAAIAYRTYSFSAHVQNTSLSDWFIHVAICNAIGCCFISCHSRFCKKGNFYRLAVFAFSYIFDTFPIMIRLLYCEGKECDGLSLYPHARQFIFMTLSAIAYGSHVPERLFPGKFDIIGHSHQWFHILVILATNDQMNAILIDLEDRKDFLATHNENPPIYLSVGAVILTGVINLTTIYVFAERLTEENLKIMETQHCNHAVYVCHLLDENVTENTDKSKHAKDNCNNNDM